MIFKYTLAAWLILTGLEAFHVLAVPAAIMGLLAIVAGLALAFDK